MEKYELSLGELIMLRSLYDSRNTSCALRTVYGFGAGYYRSLFPRLSDQEVRGRAAKDLLSLVQQGFIYLEAPQFDLKRFRARRDSRVRLTIDGCLLTSQVKVGSSFSEMQ